MSLVFDAHAHCFPALTSRQPDEDDQDMALRLRAHQYHQHTRGLPASSSGVGTGVLSKAKEWGVFRIRDNSQVHDTLMLGEADGQSWMPEVNFRIAPFGRTEFTVDGEDYRIQWLPPNLSDSSFPPELLVAHMDYVGVDRALLQHDRLYGRLDGYLAKCMERYPDRLVALAQVEEWRGGEPDQLERVRHQVQDLGFRGLYFATEGFFVNNFSLGINSPPLEPLWDLVADLGVPIFWLASNQVRPQAESYITEIGDLTEWTENHPHIRSVLTHGFPDPKHVHRDLMLLLQSPNTYVELFLLAFTLVEGGEVSRSNVSATTRKLVDELGPEKLLWGSDMPSAERHLPYMRWFDLIRHADDLSTSEQDAILGGNLELLLTHDP